jgi:hypothetical protein
MAEKHIDPTLLKEALANVDKRLEIMLVNMNKGMDLVKPDVIVSMFTLRDVLRKEQFARP